MKKSVLVTYASKYGSTAEIAQRIGEVIDEPMIEIESRGTENAGQPLQFTE